MDERLAAKASGIVRRSEAAAPGLSTIARRAHQNVAGAVCLVPFGVAVSIIGTAGGVIANAPVLVVEVSGVYGDGIPPMQAIGGTADGNVANVLAVSIQANQRQGRNEPLAVLGIVGNRGIGGRAVAAAFIVDGEPWKQAVLPGCSAIAGRGKTHVGAAPADAARSARHVKGAHNRRAPGER